MNNIHPKVSIPVMAGALVGVGMYECKRHGIEIDAVEGGFITTIVMGMLGFIVPSNDQADVVTVPPGSTALIDTPAVVPPPQTAVVRERSEPSSPTHSEPIQQHHIDDVLDIRSSHAATPSNDPELESLRIPNPPPAQT